MSIISENELKSEIKSEKFKNFYFLFGEENYLTEYYTNLLINKILGNDKIEFLLFHTMPVFTTPKF